MKIIGLSGSARSGKDSFYEFVKEYLFLKGKMCKRFAFADLLKYELCDFIISNFGFSSFTTDKRNKDILRPIMVAYGCAKREISNGRYWINNLENVINSVKDFTDVTVITDVRFCDHEEDETYWLKNKMNGVLINIELINDDGSVVPPANHEESIRSEKLYNLSDFKIHWKRFGSDEIKKEQARQQVFNFLDNNEFIWNS